MAKFKRFSSEYEEPEEKFPYSYSEKRRDNEPHASWMGTKSVGDKLMEFIESKERQLEKMRSNPVGGEYEDGVETGFERMLYEIKEFFWDHFK